MAFSDFHSLEQVIQKYPLSYTGMPFSNIPFHIQLASRTRLSAF